MKTEDILQLALRKGEITSKDVVNELVGEVEKQSDYRALLAQASTLLRRLHKRGRLERRWVKDQKGQYVYFPSEKTISSLLPALHVLEERKRRKEIEEALTQFAKEIILKLRLEDEVKGILWNPSEYEDTENGMRAKVSVVMNNTKSKNMVKTKIEEKYGNVMVDPVFVTPDWIVSQNVDSMKIFYGWNFVALTKLDSTRYTGRPRAKRRHL
jgi:hypothetical protein